MKSVIITLSLLGSFAMASEPTHLITIKQPSARNTSLDLCLEQISSVNYNHGLQQSVYSPITIVAAMGSFGTILGVSLNSLGVQTVQDLECVLSIEVNAEVGPNPSVGKNN